MIVSKKAEEYDGKFRLVLYRPDEQGRCVANLAKGDFDSEIDSYYKQRAVEAERLLRELLNGKVSPIGFFAELYHMNVKDIAARMRLRGSKVKKHMKMDGFKGITVEMLQKYARIFDVAVGDFFHLINIDDNISISSEKLNDRLFNRFTIRSNSERLGAVSEK